MRFIAALSLLAACSAPATYPRPDAPRDVSDCDYVVRVESAQPLRLDVNATCRGRAVKGLESDDPRVANVIARVESDRGVVTREKSTFLLPSEASQVTFRYRVDLDALGKGERNTDLALRSGDSLIAPSSSFLLYPWPLDVGIPIRVHIEKPAEMGFSSGLLREGDHYLLEAHEIPVATYSAFGKLAEKRVALDAGKATLDLTVLDGGIGVELSELERFSLERARAVSDFFGGFPAPHTAVFVVPIAGRRDIVFGNLRPESAPGVALLVGSHAGERAFAEDWVLVHELFHIGVPSFHAEGKWYDEGLATYLEPVIRVRAGLLDPLHAWREFALEMPRAVSALTRDGLEHTDDIYWGGAIYCLLADVEARRVSKGRLGLEDGVRHVLRAGGNASDVWSLAQTLRIADEVYPRPVLVPLWKRYAAKPAPLELEALFRSLGVVRAASGVKLDDDAPLAWVRRAIFAAKPRTPSLNARR